MEISKEKIIERLEKILKDKMGLDAKSRITEDTDLTLDLLLDSLDRYELAYHMEEDCFKDNFHLRIPDGEIMGLETVGDYVKYIGNYKG